MVGEGGGLFQPRQVVKCTILMFKAGDGHFSHFRKVPSQTIMDVIYWHVDQMNKNAVHL